MAGPGPNPLDQTAATSDPGDDVARRFAYQWTYAAIVCCQLLDDTTETLEVFCEQHEDVLAKRVDDTFIGIQVKTRESSQPPWKVSCEAVTSALVRFARLENDYPGRFSAFRFLTNHPLFAGGNGQDLVHMLALARSSSGATAPIEKLVKRIARDAGVSTDVCLAALRKAEASDDLPKLADIRHRLVQALVGVWPGAADHPLLTMDRAARELTDECRQASSLDHQSLLPAYLPTLFDAKDRELAERIDGKRLDKNRVLAVLERSLNGSATLDGDPEKRVEPGAGQETLLLKKMSAGGFSATSQYAASDLRDKSDYLGIVWTKKFGRDEGLRRYDHIRSIVLKVSAEALETTDKAATPFGPAMLSALRGLLRTTRKAGAQLFDCTDDHLEGMAFSLSAQCRVYWSPTPLPEDE